MSTKGKVLNVVRTSDWLVSETKTGHKKYWCLYVIQVDDKYYTQTHWYQMTKKGKASKEQFSDPYYAAPTNEGRANARNSREQADFEFDAIIKKQMDRGFHLEGQKSTIRPMPMLAHKFRDHTKKVEFPVFVQPKLNGMRMLFDGESGWSRGNKEIIPEVIQHLKFDTGGVILDGELMLPNNVLLQESMSAIKKYRPGVSDKLEYHVYDVVDSDLIYIKRYQLLMDICQNAPSNVKVVMTLAAEREQDIPRMHKKFVSQGYEGTMIRDVEGLYEINKRSYSLLKLKDFQDAEYRICAVIDGAGSDRDLAIFVLDNGHGLQFNCRPEGSQENRADLYKNREKLIGKYLTVRYFELSKDKVPIFPVGVGIREYGEF